MSDSKISAGDKFGRLVAVSAVAREPNQKKKWLCKCECGNTTVAEESAFLRGKRISCGCLSKEPRPYRRKHSACGTRIYRIWSNMKTRCLNPKASNYKWYGGRGITVCSEWLIFADFYSWALKNGYEESLELDRIDNDKGYCPANCRWITHKEQCNNRRTLKGDR